MRLGVRVVFGAGMVVGRVLKLDVAVLGLGVKVKVVFQLERETKSLLRCATSVSR